MTLHKSALLIALGTAALFALGSGRLLHSPIEYPLYDLGLRLAPQREPDRRVAVIAIDERALAEHGPWPWSRDVLAALQRRLDAAGAAWVAYTMSFEAPQNVRGLDIMAEFRDTYGAELAAPVRRALQAAVNRLDGDYAFGLALRAGGNGVIGLPYEYLAPGAAPEPIPERLLAHTVPAAGPPGPFARWPAWLAPPGPEAIARAFAPVAKIGDHARAWAAGPGHFQRPGGARFQPLLLAWGDRALPTLPLRIAALLEADAPVEALAGGGVGIGERRLGGDAGWRSLPFYYRPRDGAPAIPVYSAAAILAGETSAAALRGGVLLVGLTAPRFTETVEAPRLGRTTPVEALAHATSSLLAGHDLALTENAWWLRLSAFPLLWLYLGLLLPRVGRGTGLALTALIAVVLANSEIVLLATHGLWLPLGLPIAALLTGHLLVEIDRGLRARFFAYKAALTESNLQLGQALAQQGRLDQAFAKYRQCVTTEAVLEALYELGGDYERKRQFGKAAAVFEHLAVRRRRYRDVEARIERNRRLEKTVVLGSDARGPGGTLLVTAEGVQKPVLGRYEIERELGRGAMGTVYLGRDPKIGRTVAIKAMSLSQEFDEAQIEEVKQRFAREAAAAGRLNHPNIVTVYDVGEEGEVSYIAMDYLEGQPLSRFTKPDRLLDLPRVLDLLAQVADALHYAHERGVVHRDIKPENIVYDEKTGKATVTDFGVASLVDSSKTRTGVILGSPSYMSPEQLAGKRIDGRSDLYSLGVTLFQLSTGRLPFTADTLSALMYKISHDRPPDPRKLRPDLPACVATIVQRALQKDPAKRYADGAQMAAALRRCAARLAEAGEA